MSCVVGTGDVLRTGADIRTDDGIAHKGPYEIRGYAHITCPWGCSFGIVQASPTEKPFQVSLLKSYNLPDGKLVNLYKISHMK